LLPSLDSRGFLPVGVHAATFADIEVRFATDAGRVQLLNQFRGFLQQHLIAVGSGLDLVVGGSYLSDKAGPMDIDCTIKVPISDFANRIPVVALQNDGRNPLTGAKGWIWDTYKVDYWVSVTGSGWNDFENFFQYVGQKSASLKGLNNTDRRGVVKVEQWILG
jgi:hypothetical protein